MSDKRILRTKKILKQTFMNMLSKKTFEKITVKSICENSDISRITFYSHYDDKYDLVNDISEDLLNFAQNEYQKLQKENNPEKNPITSYCNFLDCILNVYHDNLNFFSHTNSYENPYLNFSFYKYILKYLEIHTKKRSKMLKPKYNIKKIAGFLCYGLLGFINECQAQKNDINTVKKEAHSLLKDILKYNILTDAPQNIKI